MKSCFMWLLATIAITAFSCTGFYEEKQLPNRGIVTESGWINNYQFERKKRLPYSNEEKVAYSFSFHNPGQDRSKAEIAAFNGEIDKIVAAIHDNLTLKDTRITILPTTFVSLDNLYHTSSFGRYATEAVTNRLHALYQPRLQVIELRKANEILVRQNGGEFSMSREHALLSTKFHANMILSGTYTVTPGTVMLSVRLIDIGTGQICSAADGIFERKNNLLVSHLISDVGTLQTEMPTRYEKISPSTVTITELPSTENTTKQ